MPANRAVIYDAGEARYPEPPYSPGARYAEYRGPDVAASPNPIYDGIRESFRMLGLDAERFGRPDWNPLGDFIRPGSRVLIKPNLVRHYHPNGLDARSLVTHASLVRAACDYALLAGGEVILADAPLQSCDFDAVCRLSGLDRLVDHYARQGVNIPLYDLRLVHALVESKTLFGKVLVQRECHGDPRGYSAVDLGAASLHEQRAVPASDFRVTCYNPTLMSRHHRDRHHQYVIANSLLEADTVINLPKMKTHQKAGITGALKNFIGVNGHKDCLPHHARGPADRGGDEYPRRSLLKQLDSWLQDRKEAHADAVVKKAVAVAHRLLFAVHMREQSNAYWAGSWHGNDTISRTTVDLNRIVAYADRNGSLRSRPQRAILTIVDGILAGEDNGPLAPAPKPAGVLLAGLNPVAVDLAMCRLMGFDYRRVPTLGHALDATHRLPLASFTAEEIEVLSNSARWRGLSPATPGDSLAFLAHSGWRGHIEL